jgi:hypothetical protein
LGRPDVLPRNAIQYNGRHSKRARLANTCLTSAEVTAFKQIHHGTRLQCRAP